MDKRLTQITVALSILGLLVAIYMTIYKLFPNSNMCIGSGGCETVNASRYSEVNGIPVAVIGMIGYASILGLHWIERKNEFFEENGSMILFGISLLGFFFTLWLIYAEIFLLSIVRVVRQP